MDKSYVRSVVTGLTVAHVCLGLAGTAAVVTVLVVGWTQLPLLVDVLPVVLIALFLAVTIKLLRNDMYAVRRDREVGR